LVALGTIVAIPVGARPHHAVTPRSWSSRPGVPARPTRPDDAGQRGGDRGVPGERERVRPQSGESVGVDELITSSIGIAVSNGAGYTSERLFPDADTAM
jgi:hypothetical protein